VASCNVDDLAPMTTYSAVYSGDAQYLGSSGQESTPGPTTFEAQLQAIRDDVATYRQQNPSPKSAYDHLTNALAHLDKALAATLWQADGMHLTSTGATVFSEDKAAMDELLKLAAPRPQVVASAIPTIVGIDRSIAQRQYDDANALISSLTPSKSADYQKAKSELATAAAELQKGVLDQSGSKWDNAIGHFKNAWQHALSASQYAGRV
jgi:hypothetical protein